MLIEFQANLLDVLTLVTKIIQLIPLLVSCFINQFLNHTLAFYRQENTLTPQVWTKLSRSWSTVPAPCLPYPAKKMPDYKDLQQSLARLLFCHLFYFLAKETISSDLLIGTVKVSLKEYIPPGQMKRLQQQNAMNENIISEEWGIKEQEVIKANVSSKQSRPYIPIFQ